MTRKYRPYVAGSVRTDRLNRLAYVHKMSRADIAKLMHRARGTVQNWFNGSIPIPLDTLELLERKLSESGDGVKGGERGGE